MSIPLFLDNSQIPYTYDEKLPITDVDNGTVGIIVQLRLRLVTGLSWTEPSTALFKTPLTGLDGTRFLDVLLTRISASTIEFRVRDAAANVLCTRRIQIDTTNGTVVRYYCNAWGVVVESLQATPEILQAHKLDVSPAAVGDVSIYVVGNGYRNNSSTADGAGSQVLQLFAWDNGVATQANRTRYRTVNLDNTLNFGLYTSSGRAVFKDAMIRASFGGTQKWAGRIPHMLQCPSDLGFGNRRKPNIDTSTKPVFQVLGLATVSLTRVAMRVGDS